MGGVIHHVESKEKKRVYQSLKEILQYFYVLCIYRGGSKRGGPGGNPTFWGMPNFIKREKTSHTCTRKRRVLVLNSYRDTPPPSEILYPPLIDMYCSPIVEHIRPFHSE